MTPFKVAMFLLIAVVLDVVFHTFQFSSLLFVCSGFLMVVFGLLMSEGESEQPIKKGEEVLEELYPSMFFDKVVREIGEDIHQQLRQESAYGDKIVTLRHAHIDHPNAAVQSIAELVIDTLMRSDAPYGLKKFEGCIQANFYEYGYEDNDYCEFEDSCGCEIHITVRFGLPGDTFLSVGGSDTPKELPEDVVEMSEEEEDEIQMEDMEDLPLERPVCKQTLTTDDIPQGKAILSDVVDTYVSDFAHLQDDLLDETLHEVQQIVLKELGHLAQGKIRVSATTSEPEAHGGVSKILFVEVMDSVGKSVVLSVTLETK